MKQLLKLSLLLLALLLPATAPAHDFQVDGIYYNINGNEATVTHGPNGIKYTGFIKIPSSITINGSSYIVSSIEDNAFSYCNDLSELEIPCSIQSIGDNAFLGCIIKKLHIGYGNWNAGSINGFTNETTVLYLNGGSIKGMQIDVDQINCYSPRPPICDENSFLSYDATVHLPMNIESEGDFYWPKPYLNQYYQDQYWKNFTFECDIEVEFCDFCDNGVYYKITSDTTVSVTFRSYIDIYNYFEDGELTCSNRGSYGENVVIPEKVSYCGKTYIVSSFDNEAFRKSEDLDQVIVKTKRITDWGRLPLVTIIDPEGGGEYCHDARVYLPHGYDISSFLSQISDYCNNYGGSCGLYLYPDFTSNHVAYYINESNEAVATFFDGLRHFSTNTSDIYYSSFEHSNSQFIPESVSFEGNNYSVTAIDNFAFSSSNISSILISDSIKKIGDMAFRDTPLSKITIGKSVSVIGDGAFADCTSLDSIICLADIPPHISFYDDYKKMPYQKYEDYYYAVESFSSYDENGNNLLYDHATVYVPGPSVDLYKNAPGWSLFRNILSEYDFEIDNIRYRINGEGVTIVKNNYSDDVIIIPSSVSYNGISYFVTSINSDAFKNCSNLNRLIIPITLDCIGANAFEGCKISSVYIIGDGAWIAGQLPASVETLYIGSGVTSVEGLQVNPATIYSYASVPPTCDGNTFTGYDATLHVPASSLAAYFTAPYWCNFINIIGDAVEPTELTFDNDSINILVGNQIQLNATLVPSNATPSLITWTSSNDSIATVSEGNITAVGVGECDIKAMLLDKVAMCHVTVTEIAPTQITLSQEFAKLEVGSQLTLTATVLPEDATDKTVTWSTTNSAVASVDSQGNVIAIGPGECFITATCRDKQATCHVVVVEHFINIQLDQHELLLLPNHIELLTPTVTPVSTDLAVTSTNPSVAAARLANGKIQVVGIAEGTTTIRVNSTDGYAEPDSCVVKVYTLRGDVNGDGFVNISDATLLISYLVAPSETIHQVNADTNNDGQINISDATRLISYLLTGEELEPKPDNEFETETITVNGVSFDMVSVEGGTFMMGATPEQGDEALDKEKPVHRVTVSSFAMSQTEVTQELWQAVMGSNPSHFTGDPKRPVELVSWNDCQTFIAQLNQLTGKRFRLPTEAEWEYAARGGNRYKVTRYAGSNNIDEVAWYDANSGNTTHPVATKAPNELGLYDMTGNVWEWCQDWYALYSADDQTDPTGPETGNNRVLRGGCWNGGTNYDRISFRDNFRPSGSNSSGGLRLVLDQEVVYTVNGVSFTMVPVKGGTFTMGATEEEDADHATFVASPKHQVTLSNFSIGQTEVTQELWVAVMGSNPSQDTSNLQYPVSYINWPDCDAFITKLNELTGLHFRLPTEAEWEYAAKGGANSQGFVYSGSDDLDEVAWISTNSDSHPHQVATKKANELGLYDMNGNIEEWCHDWYSLYTEDPVVNPSGPETGMSKVHRGGRWNGSAKYCRLTRRDGFSQGIKRNYMGMRLAL